MKTGKIFKALMLIGILAIMSPSVTFATDKAATTVETKEEQATRLQNRLEEIRAMDTRKLTKAEKKALRKEVRTIKKDLAAISGGVYLSVGAIILIALLLILLL
jgi:hypothetical protein